MLALNPALAFAGFASAQTTDPLSSWNDGDAKQANVQFVAKVTEEGVRDYVASAKRIVVSTTTARCQCRGPIPSLVMENPADGPCPQR